ncbi:class I SAM-dependent methyltransferase [Saccharopolyspora gloriosae]|uniref:O-methyltransferase involved in polyketide biosynthesis n=1 Tax=Saccharopolyspora gloriosae TaxID=455344 RepID=A0A840NLN7_9PSEU|nr:class I SAM-dependent methyltransferase [Saccharopolyspora gloriosae]MBB5071991.1 O-methyltransferase involved in polyketide biosynthesis [Saccharopolyspora gloriosae]
MTREKADFTGARATMLATLYGRALHSRTENPVLHDPYAEEAVARIDHDFSTTGLRGGDALSIALRGRTFDDLTAARLAADPEVTVLHLGCGLDSRGQRLAPPPSVEWYDIDFPEVIDLRDRIYPAREHHHTIGSPVTAPDLLDGIPNDKPALVVAEGLVMYLEEAEGVALLRRITEHFPGGHLVFDVQSPLAVRWAHRLNGAVRAADARLKWGVRSGTELERAVPGLFLDEEMTFFDIPGLERLTPTNRALVHTLGKIPTFRKQALILTMHFN